MVYGEYNVNRLTSIVFLLKFVFFFFWFPWDYNVALLFLIYICMHKKRTDINQNKSKGDQNQTPFAESKHWHSWHECTALLSSPPVNYLTSHFMHNCCSRPIKVCRMYLLVLLVFHTCMKEFTCRILLWSFPF